MSRLEFPSTVHSSGLRLDDPEDAFRGARAQDPTTPDGVHRGAPTVELSRRLGQSRVTLAASACAQIGSPPGVTIATNAAELHHSTVDPRDPRCRSFRADSYYLRGLARLDADLPTVARYLGSRAEDSRGPPDVR